MAIQRDDIASALIVIALSTLLVWTVIPAQTIPGDEGELAQSFMPTAATLIMLIAAGLLLVRTVIGITIEKNAAAKAPAPEAGGAADAGDRVAADRTFLMVLVGSVVLLSASLFVISRFGLVVGGGATILAFGLLFSRRAWLSIAVLSIAFPLVAYVLVRYGLGVAIL